MFVDIFTIYDTKKEDNLKQNMWVTTSYDSASHLENVADEIIAIFQEITGEQIDLSQIEMDQIETTDVIKPKNIEESKDSGELK